MSNSSPQPAAVKETIEHILIAFVMAFVFRAYVVEAFVIPTGSMAPTLLGEHLNVSCAQCGYRFKVEKPDNVASLTRDSRPEIVCPMCHYGNPITSSRTISAGDRILVHKYLYSFVEPQRWDVVVFKNPQDPNINFIKRLIGLPNESICIIDGNIYARPASGSSSSWSIARKSDRPQVQEAVWQPIYHSDFIPLDQGKNSPSRAWRQWETPWVAVDPRGQGHPSPGTWKINDRRAYEHDSAEPGSIRFDFQRMMEGGPGVCAYNQLSPSTPALEPIEDIRLATSVVPHAPGLTIHLSTTARLDDTSRTPMAHRLTATIDNQGAVSLTRTDPRNGRVEPLAKVLIDPLPVDLATPVELWYVDQEASVWVNGKRVIRHPFDLPTLQAAIDRAAPSLLPELQIDTQGAPVTLHRINVDRDLYYTGGRYGPGLNSGHPMAGVIIRERDGVVGGPVNLETDQFFCMGDNSPRSHDGRAWNTVNPWIRDRMLKDNFQQIGVVPRRLMMGQAFFVYYPAAYPWRPGTRGILPNFGEMRFIY